MIYWHANIVVDISRFVICVIVVCCGCIESVHVRIDKWRLQNKSTYGYKKGTWNCLAIDGYLYLWWTNSKVKNVKKKEMGDAPFNQIMSIDIPFVHQRTLYGLL